MATEFLNEKTYVEKAENVIKSLKDENKGKLVTTSKLRNILSMAADIYDKILIEPDDRISDELNARIEYLRVRVIYEYGRDSAWPNLLQKFVDKSEIINIIKQIDGDRKKYILFYRYLEALVAFHKYHGGKD